MNGRYFENNLYTQFFGTLWNLLQYILIHYEKHDAIVSDNIISVILNYPKQKTDKSTYVRFIVNKYSYILYIEILKL